MDTRLAELSNLTTSGDALSNLIEVLPFSAHIRDVKTEKYLLANQYQARCNGFDTAQEVIGLTNADLNARTCLKVSALGISSEKQQAEYQESFDRLNRKVQFEKQAIVYTEKWLPATGFVYFGESKKVPILGQNKQVIAILTVSEEVTHRANLLDIYHAYKKDCSKKHAIRQFLRYLEIDNRFTSEPTEAQILTLIAMRENSSSKYVARFLNIQPRTSEIHIRRLRAKVKNRDLSVLLAAMRNGYRSLLC